MSINVNWATCQNLSDQILAEGLLLLRSNEKILPDQVTSEDAGNYLISLDDENYIGEATNLASRIRQQFVAKTSTFYKNYLEKVATPSPIDMFYVRRTKTAIGRKELEEFGIENIPCSLNKFQLGKRKKCAESAGIALWDEIQRQHEAVIAEGEVAVLSESCRDWREASATLCAGIYLVRAPKREDILYIGESSHVQKRHKCHSSTTYFSALRRQVGTVTLGLSLTERNGKAKYFTEDEDRAVTEFLCSCQIACIPVSFGRFELESHLIRKFRPQLNRKGNAIGLAEE